MLQEIERVPQMVIDLIERFERNKEAYRSGQYNETQVRREFIDPFFKLLGWDINNEQGYAEAYKDVIHEDSIKVGGATKAPDYCFRIGGTRKFFLEAKKPAVNIRDEISPAFQLRRYAWSAKLPLSILTDFEEFAAYDCRIKPDKSDRPSVGRLLYITYDQYLERWEEIVSIFSKDAILKGSFDKFAESSKGKRGTAEVDDAFLQEIENWREVLARNIALRNSGLSQRELNFAVQNTIDRIIFLRICEDRGIEPYGQLRNAQQGSRVYEELCRLFRRADDRYNSGLFHFRKEKGRHEPPDELSLVLVIDDKPLKDILRSLYYPDSPYEFSVLPADILGQVYEQFLGKVIRLTSGRRAVVEDKPEVKKAGGVYYTPTYIVDYIVKNTVGKLLAEKTPRQATRLKILDPACGSGSFLIGAYQYLLDWHLNWYIQNGPQKHTKEIHQGPTGEWRLTTAERKRILLNNIYGVDIDSQAVEVTKLSLLLKILEGETEQSITAQLKLFQERALPDLGDNIKCGNSLVGPDFYNQHQMNFLDEEDRYRINVFDWKAEFAEIIRASGFDAVIGNPPYLRIQGLQEFYGDQVEYLATHYKSAIKRFDLYLLFIERGFYLLNTGGRLGFICPHKFLNSDFGSGLRGFLIANSALEAFISFGNNLIFDPVTTYTGFLFLRKARLLSFKYYEFTESKGSDLSKRLSTLSDENFTEYRLQDFTNEPWVLTTKHSPAILQLLSEQSKRLADVCDEILVGVQSGIDNVHVMKFIGRTSKGETLKLFSERAGEAVEIEAALVKPFLTGKDVKRYAEPEASFYCIYPYQFAAGKTRILEESELKSRYPLGYAYLREYRKELTEIRIRQKTNPKYWYSCHRSRDMSVFEKKRIVTPEISLGCNMTIGPAGLYHNTQVYSLVPSSRQAEHLNYWLGIVNSRLLWWFLTQTGNVLHGGYFRFKTNYLQPFPIHVINFADPTDKAKYDRIVRLVDDLLTLHKQNMLQQKQDMSKPIFSAKLTQLTGGLTSWCMVCTG